MSAQTKLWQEFWSKDFILKIRLGGIGIEEKRSIFARNRDFSAGQSRALELNRSVRYQRLILGEA